MTQKGPANKGRENQAAAGARPGFPAMEGMAHPHYFPVPFPHFNPPPGHGHQPALWQYPPGIFYPPGVYPPGFNVADANQPGIFFHGIHGNDEEHGFDHDENRGPDENPVLIPNA